MRYPVAPVGLAIGEADLLHPARDVAQARRPPGRHIVSTRMLLSAASSPGPARAAMFPSCPCRRSERRLLGNRPHKPGQFPRHCDCGDLAQLTPTHKTPELAVQP